MRNPTKGGLYGAVAIAATALGLGALPFLPLAALPVVVTLAVGSWLGDDAGYRGSGPHTPYGGPTGHHVACYDSFGYLQCGGLREYRGTLARGGVVDPYRDPLLTHRPFDPRDHRHRPSCTDERTGLFECGFTSRWD